VSASIASQDSISLLEDASPAVTDAALARPSTALTAQVAIPLIKSTESATSAMSTTATIATRARFAENAIVDTTSLLTELVDTTAMLTISSSIGS